MELRHQLETRHNYRHPAWTKLAAFRRASARGQSGVSASRSEGKIALPLRRQHRFFFFCGWFSNAITYIIRITSSVYLSNTKHITWVGLHQATQTCVCAIERGVRAGGGHVLARRLGLGQARQTAGRPETLLAFRIKLYCDFRVRTNDVCLPQKRPTGT